MKNIVDKIMEVGDPIVVNPNYVAAEYKGVQVKLDTKTGEAIITTHKDGKTTEEVIKDGRQFFGDIIGHSILDVAYPKKD